MGACAKIENEYVQLELTPKDRAALPAWKRVLDLCCILAATPIILPLASLTAALIKVVSPGPVLFRQERIGYLGKRFVCLKFRTMEVGADPAVHEQHLGELINAKAPLTKIDQMGDPRLIPLGGLLRASGLDELPQIVNVLRREMSLVGPRPCTVYEYDRLAEGQKRRFKVLPGITGLWQTQGKNRTTFDQMVSLDIHYATGRSLWMDAQILLRTIPVVCSQMLHVFRRGRAKPARS